MATRAQEAEILQGGTDAGSTTPGAFVLNMLSDEGSWKVRKGFGQVAQFDTSMSQNISGPTTDWGYQKHLGSHYMKTDFGHEQIITLLASKNITSSADRHQQIHDLYSVNIYDVTTGDRWEEVVFRQTCENANTGFSFFGAVGTMYSMPYWHGVYETSWDKSYQSWASSQSGVKDAKFRDEPVLLGGQSPPYFVEFGDILYFGTKETGLLAYVPSTFKGNRGKSVNDAYRHEWAGPYSETAVIRRCPMVPGIEGDNFDYYSTGNFPQPSCSAKFVNRLVYGSGRFIFFSDPGFVSSVVIENTVEIPCDGEITALVECGGSVIIFTQSETWAYRPADSFIATNGILERISKTVGCISPSAVTKAQEGAYWADMNGCYSMSNALQLSTVSGPISEFFSSSITNPLTSYYTLLGFTGMDVQQPRTSARMDSDGVSVVFAPSVNSLMVNIPAQDVTLCLTDAGWSVWTYTSMVYGSPSVGIRGGADASNPEGPIHRASVVASGTDVWLVGSLDKQLLDDSSNIDNDTKSSSYCIMRYGRGGSIDRSVAEWDVDVLNKKGREDKREFVGRYSRKDVRNTGGVIQAINKNATVFMEKAIEVPQSFVFANGNYSGATAGAGNGPAIPASENIRVALYPLRAALKWGDLGNAYGGGCSGNSALSVTTGAIETITLSFQFDSTKWRPVFSLTGSASAAVVSTILPPERKALASVISAVCYSDAALTTPSVEGSYLRVIFDGASIPGSAAFAEFNFSDGKLDPMIYLPFYTTTTTPVAGLGVGTVKCSVSDVSAANTMHPSFYVWQQMVATASMRKEDAVAVPIDWAYKGNPVQISDNTRVKSRGLVSLMKSRGRAEHPLDSNWPFGVFNSLASADLKCWTSQIVDYTGAGTSTISEPESIKKIGDFVKTGIRTRIMPSGGTLTTRTFSSSGTNVSKAAWGNTDPAAHGSVQGNYLIDDEEVSEIITSDSVKGDKVTYMIFGHIQNKAQALTLGSVKVLFRALGFTRRKGK